MTDTNIVILNHTLLINNQFSNGGIIARLIKHANKEILLYGCSDFIINALLINSFNKYYLDHQNDILFINSIQAYNYNFILPNVNLIKQYLFEQLSINDLATFLSIVYDIPKNHNCYFICNPVTIILSGIKALIKPYEYSDNISFESIHDGINKQCEQYIKSIIILINNEFHTEFTIYYLTNDVWLIGFNEAFNLDHSIHTIDIIHEDMNIYLQQMNNIAFTKIITDIQVLLYQYSNKHNYSTKLIKTNHKNIQSIESMKNDKLIKNPIDTIWFWNYNYHATSSKYTNFISQIFNQHILNSNDNINSTDNNKISIDDDNKNTSTLILNKLYNINIYFELFKWQQQYTEYEILLERLLLDHHQKIKYNKLSIFIVTKTKILRFQYSKWNKYKFWYKIRSR